MTNRATNNNSPLFSIIIPVSKADMYLDECIAGCQALDYSRYEILLMPDLSLQKEYPGVRVHQTSFHDPSAKRNLGISLARGDICAFLDADAYPAPDWLTKAEPYFDNLEVAAVGGPNLTPSNDGRMQKAGGLVLSSPLGGGFFASRYSKAGAREGGELQSVNMFVRKTILNELGGFEVGFWPGEDAKLCFQISHVLKKKVVYSPELIVFHHRRQLFLPHLKQIWNYGLTKARLVKRFFSGRKLAYFAPSALLVGLAGGALLSFVHPIARVAYLSGLGLYAGVTLIVSFAVGGILLGGVVFLGTVLTHLTYGLATLVGLFRKASS